MIKRLKLSTQTENTCLGQKLCLYETLDAAQIKSIYETGKMPGFSGDSEEDNHALILRQEVKERIENKK